MDLKILKWLEDIQMAILEIKVFLKEKGINSFDAYTKDRMVKRAIERDLAIIGEAINRIVKYEPKMISSIQHAKAIISLRNYVVHAYDSVSDENIWSILINHLPKLEQEVNGLLEQNEDEETTIE